VIPRAAWPIQARPGIISPEQGRIAEGARVMATRSCLLLFFGPLINRAEAGFFFRQTRCFGGGHACSVLTGASLRVRVVAVVENGYSSEPVLDFKN
jgi:hypothetical protein